MHIIGTAGHVDHGKSSLVEALTGTHPDRWDEERVRGMTLDLGFAQLTLQDGTQAGIIDVPGHERFLHNMLAGAAGMELLLLVIAANEGIKPQTIEHLQILAYLNVARTLVVLTKSDLVTEAELAQMRLRLVDALRGTIAAEAAMVAVSSTTGSGLAELRAAIGAALQALAPRAPEAPVYLPIDRVFTLTGRGTIVTGTLMQGTISIGDSVLIQPQGTRARVRSLQVFGHAQDRASGGTRVALNLGGTSHHEIARGDLLAAAELRIQADFDVRFTPLEAVLPLLRRRTAVRAYIGAAEILGTLRFESVPTAPGEVRAQLHLRAPTVAFPGVRFVVRRVSPKTLLGGGVVEGVTSAVDGVGTSAVDNVLLAIARERGFQSIEPTQAAFLANLREELAGASLEALAQRGEMLKIARPLAYVDAVAADDVVTRVLDALDDAQMREPWAMGMTSLALARALGVDEALLIRVLAVFAQRERLIARSGFYSTRAHEPTLTSEQKVLFDRISLPNPEQPYVPCAFGDVQSTIRTSKVTGAVRAFDTLLARGNFVKVGDDLYRGAQIAEIHEKIATFSASHERMTMAEFRDLIGTSRKYAVPLLEWFDARAITMREGDYRRMRRS